MLPIAKVGRIALLILFACMFSSAVHAQFRHTAPSCGDGDEAASTAPHILTISPYSQHDQSMTHAHEAGVSSIRPQVRTSKAAFPPLLSLTMPDDLAAVHGRTFSIPIRFRTFDVIQVESFSFGLRFDTRSIEVLGVTPAVDALANGFSIDVRSTVDGVEISADGGAFTDSSGILLELTARTRIPEGLDTSFEVIQRELAFSGPADFGPDVKVMFINGALTISGDCIEPLKTMISLSGFAPNPFNASTTVTLRADEESSGEHAVVEVLNMQGQRVQVLFDGTLTAGTHTLRFDGGDLPSGMYFARLRIGRMSQTRSVRLVK
jgi:hypothetical protein